MKIGLILMAVFQSFWSIELGLASFRYVVGLSLFWSAAVCLALSIIDFNFYYFLAEWFRRLLMRIPFFKNRLGKRQSNLENPWVRRCHHLGRAGLFLAAAVPRFLFFGIAAQKIFKFKHGYWFLFFGNVLKTPLAVFEIQLLICFIQWLKGII